MQQPLSQITTTLLEMSRPFGGIETCTVQHASNDGVFDCFVSLKEPRNHAPFAHTVGGQFHDQGVRIQIRVRS
jgi:hypothetical protein